MMRTWTLTRIWTIEEEQILRKYYPKERAKGVQKRMPYRTRRSIYGKAYHMGMRLQIEYDHQFKKWSARELKTLKKFYPREGAACVKRFKRSRKSVVAMAGALGLQKQPFWSYKEDTVLQQYYQSEGPDCYKRLPNRSRQAAQQRARYIGLTAEKSPQWSEEEINLLKNYPDLEIEELQTLLPDRTKFAILNQRSRLEAKGELTFIKKSARWSEEEDAILRQHYLIEGADCDKYLPNRTRSTVRQRARFLGLYFIADWSEEEDAIMRQYYQSEGADCYKRLPNRTRVAAQHRAGFLGLTASPPSAWSEEELEILKQNPDLKIEALQTLLPGRTTYAIKTKRKRLRDSGELTASKPIAFWSEEEDAILRQHYPIEGANCDKYLPNRTRGSIRKRARDLKLYLIAKPDWSEEEDAVLQQYYQSEGTDCYKRLPNRSRQAARHRARSIGLTAEKSLLWSEEEINLLKNYPDLEIEELQTLLPDRTKSAILIKRTRLEACGELGTAQE
jgi:hypothetical protein